MAANVRHEAEMRGAYETWQQVLDVHETVHEVTWQQVLGMGHSLVMFETCYAGGIEPIR